MRFFLSKFDFTYVRRSVSFVQLMANAQFSKNSLRNRNCLRRLPDIIKFSHDYVLRQFPVFYNILLQLSRQIACAPSDDSDQHTHPPFVDSQGSKASSGGQQIPRPACWAHLQSYKKCCAKTLIIFGVYIAACWNKDLLNSVHFLLNPLSIKCLNILLVHSDMVYTNKVVKDMDKMKMKLFYAKFSAGIGNSCQTSRGCLK